MTGSSRRTAFGAQLRTGAQVISTLRAQPTLAASRALPPLAYADHPPSRENARRKRPEPMRGPNHVHPSDHSWDVFVLPRPRSVTEVQQVRLRLTHVATRT